jgi:hypothetical protein
MGCDIHTFVEIRQDGRWVKAGDAFPLHENDVRRTRERTLGDQPFDWRSYGMFGFLAGVRNGAHVPTIVPPRGIPDNLSPEVSVEWRQELDWGGHTPSWLTVAELQAFDYDQIFWNESEGKEQTVREVLPSVFFRDLAILIGLGPPEDVRIVFWFDN